VWNSDNWVSPYPKIAARGTINIYNRFIVDTNPLLLTNVLSVGVGNSIPQTDTYGIYTLDKKGTEILNSQNKMLRMVAQFANVVTAPNLGLGLGTGIREGFRWSTTVDLTDLNWRSSNRWVSISPLICKVYFPAANGFLFISTIFYMDSDNLYLGEYYYADTTSFGFLIPGDSHVMNVMLFAEGN
jgi:hypothetical protein